MSVACGGGDSASQAADSGAAAPGASPEVQDWVRQIDELLVVPQDEYPNGVVVSNAFEELLKQVTLQEHTLRMDRTAKSLGYFIATGHSLGWYPQESDIAKLAEEWQKVRPDVLAGP